MVRGTVGAVAAAGRVGRVSSRRAAIALACAAGLAVAAAPAQGAGALKEVKVFTLSWVGDMAFGSEQGLPAGDVGGALGPVKSLLAADVVTGNLEGTLATGGSSKCGGGGSNCFAFRAPPRYAGGLRRVGFDLVNVANNHANDYGESGQAETAAALRAARLAYTGRPGQITTLTVQGAKVAFVGFAPYPWAAPLLDIGAAQALVRQAKANADLVVVFMHQGAEGADKTHVPFGSETAFGEDRGNARAFTHAVIDAGAGLVLGSGPHVIRGIERYRGHMIAYSLGNFAGPNTLGTSGTTGLSAILRVKLTSDGDVLGGRWIPIRLERPGVPRYDASRSSTALVRRLSLEDFGDRYSIFSNGRIARDPAVRRR
ncbi:MAG: CapA family protein [Solirubrobacterales bacterium]|nr:CapA family protein [Solirubrobacterales bacterium]